MAPLLCLCCAGELPGAGGERGGRPLQVRPHLSVDQRRGVLCASLLPSRGARGLDPTDRPDTREPTQLPQWYMDTHTHTHTKTCFLAGAVCYMFAFVSFTPHHSSDLTNRVSEEPRRGERWVVCTQRGSARWRQRWVQCAPCGWRWEFPGQLHPFSTAGRLSSALKNSPAIPSAPAPAPPPRGRA